MYRTDKNLRERRSITPFPECFFVFTGVYWQTNCPARRPWVPAMPMELPAQGVL
jgi:hypothetical protein